MIRPHIPALAAAAALLSGCVASGPFPSLAPRAVEGASFDEPVRPRPFVAPDPALRTRTALLLAEAERGQSGFAAAAAEARALAGRAGAPESESWIAAQQGISVAEAARGPTATALADLDALALERAAIATNEADFAAIEAARIEALRIAEGQRAEIARLRASLR